MIRLARIINNTNNWLLPSGTQSVDGFLHQGAVLATKNGYIALT